MRDGEANTALLSTDVGVKGTGAVKDLFDVNGEDFWNHWVEAGGNMDAYIKENLPNYGLVGALLVTSTWSYILSPPDGIDSNKTSGTIFILLMVIASLLNFVLIIMSLVIYTQYCCCVS